MMLFGERTEPAALKTAWDELTGSATVTTGRAPGWRPHAA